MTHLSEATMTPNEQPRTSFWSTVTWPRREGIPILVGGPICFFIVGWLYSSPLYGFASAAIMTPVLAILWALHRVMKAWAEWPSRLRWVAWLKSAVRYLLTDS
jgi:hypothetical protein